MSGTATVNGPVETTYETAEPGSTSVAAAGVELMTTARRRCSGAIACVRVAGHEAGSTERRERLRLGQVDDVGHGHGAGPVETT